MGHSNGLWVWIVTAAGVAILAQQSLCSADELELLANWSAFRGVAVRELANLPGYRPGDLIVEADVKPILDQFRRMGWVVRQRRLIERDLLKEKDFIARKLHTKQGKKFMRQIAKYPNAYDRLYRLASLSNGRATVSDLISDPGGYKMIEYLATAKGGKNMGKMLSHTTKGKGFNKPTGRIFTEKQLLDHLHQYYVLEVQDRAKEQDRTKAVDGK